MQGALEMRYPAQCTVPLEKNKLKRAGKMEMRSFVLWSFVYMAIMALLADSINMMSGPGYISEETLESLPHPQFMKTAFLYFTEHFDPLLRANPAWLYGAFIPNFGSIGRHIESCRMPCFLSPWPPPQCFTFGQFPS